jgi:hypothetical protein
VLCVLAALVLSTVIGIGIYYWYNFHGRIKPTELSEPEQEVLSEKLTVAAGEPVIIHPEGIESPSQPTVLATAGASAAETVAEAVAESEAEAQAPSDRVVFEDDKRTLVLSERELNGFLHHNTDLAERLRIELSADTITAKTITHFDETTPMVGGRTVRVNFAIGAYLDTNGQLILEIDDISAGGIPIPNAWLGDIKNKNLIDFGDKEGGSGILRKIAEGIADFKVEDGQIRIRLNE